MNSLLYKYSVFFAVMGLLLSPFNFVAVSDIRFSEIFILGAFILGVKFVKFPPVTLTVFGIFLILYIGSAFIGFGMGGNNELIFFVFLYKYLFIFILFSLGFLITSRPNSLRRFFKSTLTVYIFLVVWAIFYSHFLSFFYSNGINSRVAFPSNQGYMATDAHLYSFVLGFLFLVFNHFLRKVFNIRLLSASILTACGLYALYLTGSRTGLLMVIVVELFYMFFLIIGFVQSYKSFTFSSLSLLKFFVFMCFVLLFSVYAFDNLNFDISNVRVFSLDLQNDDSSMARIVKLFQAIDDYSNGVYIFGVGAAMGSQIWYDGIYSTLLVHMGPLGCLLYIITFLLAFHYIYKNTQTSIKDKIFMSGLLLYVFLCLTITEYILVARGAIIVLLVFSVLLLRDRKFDSLLFNNNNR